MAQEQPADVHPRPEPCRQQIKPTDLAVEEERVHRRGVPEIPVGAQLHAGVAHALGAKAKFAYTTDLSRTRLSGTHNLNATRLGLRAGVEGDITKDQTLRLEGGWSKALGKSNGTGTALMASWNMAF